MKNTDSLDYILDTGTVINRYQRQFDNHFRETRGYLHCNPSRMERLDKLWINDLERRLLLGLVSPEDDQSLGLKMKNFALPKSSVDFENGVLPPLMKLSRRVLNSEGVPLLAVNSLRNRYRYYMIGEPIPILLASSILGEMFTEAVVGCEYLDEDESLLTFSRVGTRIEEIDQIIDGCYRAWVKDFEEDRWFPWMPSLSDLGKGPPVVTCPRFHTRCWEIRFLSSYFYKIFESITIKKMPGFRMTRGKSREFATSSILKAITTVENKAGDSLLSQI